MRGAGLRTQTGGLVTGAVLGGRYRVDAPLGRGGFGALYRGFDQRIGQPVAIKVLLRHMEGQAGGLERFRREARLAMRLSHPSTVRVLDSGEGDDGVPYVVFELLDGRSLDDELTRTGALPPARAARIATQMLAALDEAHRLSIVHRDIKPANVFLCAGGNAPVDRVKVLDFGIAKATASTTSAGLTAEGQIVGTPAYMAPEQVAGGDVGPTADLYAVGLVLAELLTGEPVFRGAGLDVLMAKLSGRATPLSDSVRASPLGPVVARATALAPAERFGSAGEMSAAIERAMPSDIGSSSLFGPSIPAATGAASSASPGRSSVASSPQAASAPPPVAMAPEAYFGTYVADAAPVGTPAAHDPARAAMTPPVSGAYGAAGVTSGGYGTPLAPFVPDASAATGGSSPAGALAGGCAVSFAVLAILGVLGLAAFGALGFAAYRAISGPEGAPPPPTGAPTIAGPGKPAPTAPITQPAPRAAAVVVAPCSGLRALGGGFPSRLNALGWQIGDLAQNFGAGSSAVEEAGVSKGSARGTATFARTGAADAAAREARARETPGAVVGRDGGSVIVVVVDPQSAGRELVSALCR